MTTFGDVRRLVAEYAGRGGVCPTSKTAETFARTVLESLLYSGQYGSQRRFDFVAERGRIALPPELQTPLQVKINDQVGTVWNKWMTFASVSDCLKGCEPLGRVIQEEPNPVFTVYDVPEGGSKLGVMGTCQESEDAHLIVTGQDITGREIITTFEGQQIVGEKFRIRKNNLRFGQVIFGKITGVTKSKTQGYVQLWATNHDASVNKFLGDYSPLEEAPQYSAIKLISPNCPPYVKVSIIGRIRLKEKYADNDIIPFDSTFPITMAAQRIQSEANNDIQTAGYKVQALANIIENEAGYKKVNPGTPVNVFYPLSGGAVRGIRR